MKHYKLTHSIVENRGQRFFYLLENHTTNGLIHSGMAASYVYQCLTGVAIIKISHKDTHFKNAFDIVIVEK